MRPDCVWTDVLSSPGTVLPTGQHAAPSGQLVATAPLGFPPAPQELPLRILPLFPVSLRSANGLGTCQQRAEGRWECSLLPLPSALFPSTHSSSSRQVAQAWPKPLCWLSAPRALHQLSSFLKEHAGFLLIYFQSPSRTVFETAMTQLTLCPSLPRFSGNSLAGNYQHYASRKEEETEGEGQSMELLEKSQNW